MEEFYEEEQAKKKLFILIILITVWYYSPNLTIINGLLLIHVLEYLNLLYF